MTSRSEVRRVALLLKGATKLALVNHMIKLQDEKPDSDLIVLIQTELERRQETT